ncbi:hypothetical protein G6F50_017190 [Rhizopus delemar]|uniref:Uncharacterized protein n=1 Tax=Rhizopus delemar TaxID=936053 RepID=A0A9P6XRC5_9FUNG|nr:hypothetical protein G6F50_017190 [Rhizopus delemar]
MPLISTTVIGSCISCATWQPMTAPHDGCDQRGQDGGAARHPQIFGVDDPGQRVMPQQHVAQRPAAQRRHAGDDADAHPVHVAPARRQRRGHGFGHDGDEVQRMQQGGGNIGEHGERQG